jgi:hypothetical protein
LLTKHARFIGKGDWINMKGANTGKNFARFGYRMEPLSMPECISIIVQLRGLSESITEIF